MLITHPDIREVAVIGRPDRKWSERVVACVVPKPDTNPSRAQIIAWSRGRLAGLKRPTEVIIITPDEMPLNTTGRISHHKLREMINNKIV